MILKFIYKFIPIPVIYTERFVPMAGRSYGIFILIKPEHKGNEAIIAHELVHCKQFYRTFGIHGILYNISDKYKLKAEIEAYRETIRVKGYKDKRGSAWIVRTLLNDYDLNVTKEEVEALLYGED